MKFTIILKQQDADGLGGDLLEAMGMVRSEHAPTVFTRQLPMHNVEKLGTGDNSWSQPEQHTQMYVEALADYGIRPMRVFQKHDSAAGLTPLHASAWADAAPEESISASEFSSALNEYAQKEMRVVLKKAIRVAGTIEDPTIRAELEAKLTKLFKDIDSAAGDPRKENRWFKDLSQLEDSARRLYQESGYDPAIGHSHGNSVVTYLENLMGFSIDENNDTYDHLMASAGPATIEQALSQVESAVEALSGGKVEAANPKMYAQSALKSLARLEGHIKKILQETDGNEYDSSHLAGLDEALDELISRFIGY